MFRKLKFVFIITNLTIISILFVLLTLGAYIMLEVKMIKQADYFSKKLAIGINSGIFPELRPEDDAESSCEPRPHKYHEGHPETHPEPPDSKRPLSQPPHASHKEEVFYIKINDAGRIRFKSPGCHVQAALLEPVVRKTMDNHTTSGVIRIMHTKYYYYATPLLKEPGTLVIFEDLVQDRNIQQSLVIPLIFICCGYIVLVFISSRFLAQRAVEPIQRAWQQQKDFVGDASHELRTPLAVIQTNLEVVMDNQDETVASQKEWLTNIQEELGQMTSLVNSLLFLARVDTKQGVLERRIFNLNQLLRRTCEAFKPLLAAKNIELVTGGGAKILCYGDESMLRQVIENLLDNALRHTPDGGRISVSLEQTGKKIQLRIADNGEGIAAKHLDKIFDRFYQVDSSRSKGKSGLGLAIVKSIVENHAGSIQVTSQPGKGTVFTVQLPCLKEHGGRDDIPTCDRHDISIE